MEEDQSVVKENEEIPIKKEKKMQKNYTLNASNNKHTKKKYPLWNEKYPLSSEYRSEWVFENQTASNTMWQIERLFEDLEPKSGMRIQYTFPKTMKGECRR
ncbi:hypothetical protein CEE35_07165 [Candidatus Aerophobetes bacterium Ae_b3b]|nr:MAG: hypothetical protein CEE35_07165 [Candidatus Aerophobetes bacterium Ae_b3b]